MMWLEFLLTAPAAIIVSLVFFGGLWITVKRLPHTPHPARWLLISLVIRFACMGLLFYLLARYGGIGPLLFGLIIIIATRFVLLRWLPRNSLNKPAQRQQLN